MDLGQNRIGGRGLDSSGSGGAAVAGSFGHGNETSGFIKDRESLDKLSVPLSFSRRTLLHGVG
jgi:hypothetical protein